MDITKSIRALLAESKMKQGDLVECLNVATKQSLSNKAREQRWSASDLVTIAHAAGAKLAFILPNGERIIIGEDRETTPQGNSEPPGSTN